MTVREALRHSFSVIARVYRQGGTGHIALPDPATGKLTIMIVNQRAAEEIIAWAADMLIADIRRRKDHGKMLSASDEKTLSLWHDRVPHAYSWGKVPGGPSFLTPLNASGEPIEPLHEGEIVLAAHPSEYDIGWRVPKTKRVPSFRDTIRLDGSHRWGCRELIGYLPFPPGTGLLSAWTRLEHLNLERTVERLSPEDRRHRLLPYGATASRDGREIIFNRDYQPLAVRSGPAGHPDERLFYFDGHSEDEKRRRAEEALRHFRAGEPLPPGWRAPRRP